MLAFYPIISFVFFLMGSYHLFFVHSYVLSIHFLLISLYFYVIYFEIRGNPFSRYVYLLLAILFVGDGVMNLLWFKTNMMGGLFSLAFAYFSWRTYQRIEN